MAAKKRNFTELPTILAIIEVRFAPPDNFRVQDFYNKAHKDVIKLGYPFYTKRMAGDIKLSDIAEGHTYASINNPRIDGYLYTTNDKSRDFIVSLGRFNFQQHSKLNNWDSFKNEFENVWNVYSDLLTPLKISRVSLRFISKVNISEKVDDPTKFFNTVVSAENGIIPPTVNDYFIKYSYFTESERVIVSQALDTISDSNNPFIIDIDAIYEKELICDISKVWKIVDNLYKLQYNIFNNNLTEYTKKKFLK